MYPGLFQPNPFRIGNHVKSVTSFQPFTDFIQFNSTDYIGLNRSERPQTSITEQVFEPESSLQSGVTMQNNVVDNIEQYKQHNIVSSCFQQFVIFCHVESRTMFKPNLLCGSWR